MEVNVSWELTYVERRKNLEEALRAVKRGAKVFLGTAYGEPQYLVEGLIDHDPPHKAHGRTSASGFLLLPFRLTKQTGDAIFTYR
jgi:acyl-CoA hydrolase